jgi:hypothetical protein
VTRQSPGTPGQPHSGTRDEDKGEGATRVIAIPTSDGASTQVAVSDTGIPGLVVHAALSASGWTLTHEPSGRCAGWWPEGSTDQAFACARALGRLADWQTTDLRELATRKFWKIILGCGGWAPTRSGQWYKLDDAGDVTLAISAEEAASASDHHAAGDVEKIGRRLHAAVVAGDWDTARSLIHPDVHWTLARGRTLCGRTKVMAMLQQATEGPAWSSSIELLGGQIYRRCD